MIELKKRNCPVCGDDFCVNGLGEWDSPLYVREYLPIGSEEVPLVVQCIVCGMVYLNPVMTDKEYSNFYTNDGQKKFVEKNLDETAVQYEAKISKDDKRRAELIREYIKDGSRVLDVGTGYSGFVGLVDGARGIDVSEPRVKMAQQRGMDVSLCNIFDWEDEMDIITLFHVLEHITEPAPFVKQIHKLLGDEGKFIIEVPSVNDLLVRNEAYRKFYFQNAHCSYFSYDTLEDLLWSCGFKIEREIKIQRYMLNNHLHWWLKRGPGKFKVPNILNRWYSSILKKRNLHDTLLLICTKE